MSIRLLRVTGAVPIIWILLRRVSQPFPQKLYSKPPKGWKPDSGQMLGFPTHDSYGLRLLGFQLLAFLL